MERIKKVFLAVLLITSFLCGCEKKNNEDNSKSINIVTTIFPAYDWVKNIIGDNPGKMEITMLLGTGVDLHSYQPTADDILKISSCDLFVYVGGESDEWVDDVLETTAADQKMKVINMLSVLGDYAKQEEIIEGMEQHDHDHEEDDHEEHDHEEHDHEEPEYDEHVWLSLKNAGVLVRSIAEEIGKIDSENAATYLRNAETYIGKIESLDVEYQNAVSAASVNTLLFADRFPFRYLVDDYGLGYYAAFAGCSAESEASFETITFLAQKVDALSLSAVMVIEGSDGKIARTVIENTRNKNQRIIMMNSMQSITKKDIEEGVSYLSIMESNLSALKDALK